MKVAVAATAGVLAWAGTALAAEITIMTSQGCLSGVRDLAAGFEKATGNKVNVSFEAGNALNEKIDANAPADLVANTLDQFDPLVMRGKVVSGSFVEFARAGNGVAAKAGTIKRDISTPEAFKRALLAAESIAYPDPSGGAQDGTYFAGLIMRMGIADELKPKIKLTQGGDAAAQLVAAGGAQIGVAQRRNFNTLKGVELLEPLPDLPGIKFLMVAGVAKGAHEHEGALALAKFLASPAVAPTIVAKGMEPYATLK